MENDSLRAFLISSIVRRPKHGPPFREGALQADFALLTKRHDYKKWEPAQNEASHNYSQGLGSFLFPGELEEAHREVMLALGVGCGPARFASVFPVDP